MNTLTQIYPDLANLINQNNIEYFEDFLNDVKKFNIQLWEKNVLNKLDSSGFDCRDSWKDCSIIQFINFDSEDDQQIPFESLEDYMSHHQPENIILKSVINDVLNSTNKQAEYIFWQDSVQN